MHRPKTYRRKSRKGKRSTKRRVGGHALYAPIYWGAGV